MKPTHGLMYRAALALVILCTGSLVYNMVAITIYKEQVFLERETISAGGEMTILIGFIFVVIFNIVSLLWVVSRIRQAQIGHKGNVGVLALGVLCFILLLGEKVLVDEISHEYQLGLEVVGEWIILYVFLTIQLLYNVVILWRVYRQDLPAISVQPPAQTDRAVVGSGNDPPSSFHPTVP